MTDLNYLHLSYFWTTVKERGFLRASKKLGVSQSTVSTQIRLLEKSLSTPLLRRGPRIFELTPEGQKTFDACEQIFSAGENLLADLKTGAEPQRRLRVGIGAIIRADDFVTFRKRIQKQEGLSFHFERQDTENLFENLFRLRLDVVLSDTRPSQTKSVALSGFKLWSSSFVLAGKSKWQRKAKGDLRSWSEIPLCLPSITSPARRHFEDWAKKKSVRPRYQINDWEWARRLAIEGEALSLLPSHLIDFELKKETLEIVHEFRDCKAEVFAYFRKTDAPLFHA